MIDKNDQEIGGYGKVPPSTVLQLSHVLSDLIKNNLNIEISNGETALLWHLISVIDETLVITTPKELWILTHSKMFQSGNRMMEYVFTANSKEVFIKFCNDFFKNGSNAFPLKGNMETEQLVQEIHNLGYIVLINIQKV